MYHKAYAMEMMYFMNDYHSIMDNILQEIAFAYAYKWLRLMHFFVIDWRM